MSKYRDENIEKRAMNNSEYSTLSLLPPTSLRDIISLMLILKALPLWVNGIIFTLYILSGSFLFIGGKLCVKYFEFKNNPIGDSFYYSNAVDFKKLLVSFTQVMFISSLLVFLVEYLCPPIPLIRLDVFAKAIVSAEWIGTSTSTFTYISNGQSKVTPKSITKPLHNNFIKIIYCYIIVLMVEFVDSNLNLPLILKYLQLSDYKSIFSTEVLTSYKLIKRLSRTTIHALPIYHILCVNVILLRFKPLFSSIGLKKISNNLDRLSNLNSGDCSIDFKRNKHFKDEHIMINNEDLPKISLKHKFNLNQIKKIHLAKVNSNFNIHKQNSSFTKNLEIFSLKLFTNQSRVQPNVQNIKVNKNSTLIINKNLSIVQSFWSVLAFIKLIVKNPDALEGVTNVNSSGFVDQMNEIAVSINLIDGSKVLVNLLHYEEIFDDLNLVVNDIPWPYFSRFESYLLIYGLSKDFQYEIQIKHGDRILNRFEVNTCKDHEKILDNTQKDTLTTLRSSLITAVEELHDVETEMRDYKKEESKRQLTAKKKNDKLTEIITKTAASDESISKKIKSIQQTTSQFKIDIRNMQAEMSDYNDRANEVSNEERKYESEIMALKEDISKHEKAVEEEYSKLKHAINTRQAYEGRFSRLVNKYNDTQFEIDNCIKDIEGCKGYFMDQLRDRTQKINEYFDTVLLKIKSETMELERKMSEMTDHNGKVY